MPKLRVLEKFCKGCGLCIAVCPKKALYLNEDVDRRGVHVVKMRKEISCTACLNCVTMCPDAALEVDED